MSRTKTLRKQTRSKARAANKKAAPVAADARDTAARYAGQTRDWAAPRVEAAKEWAAPRVEPAVEKVQKDVLPAVAGAVTAALAASEPARHEAASRGSAALAALKGEVAPPKPKRHRVRKLFLLATVLGAAYAGWKAWAAKSSSDPAQAWSSNSSSYGAGSSAGSAGVTSVSAARPTTDDAAGAGPDEALADAADEAKVEDEPAGGKAAGTTTEKVTPKNARKVSDAAAKGSSDTKG